MEKRGEKRKISLKEEKIGKRALNKVVVKPQRRPLKTVLTFIIISHVSSLEAIIFPTTGRRLFSLRISVKEKEGTGKSGALTRRWRV